MSNVLTPKKTGLWIVDMQEKLLPQIDRSQEICERICWLIEVAKSLQLPLFVTEQYPQGLGRTVAPLRSRLGQDQVYHPKTCFSGYESSDLRKEVDQIAVSSWLLVGIEAHICVLQTAKSLLAQGFEVVVLNDATSSRSMFDFSTAMGELRDAGVRLSSSETVVYEMIGDAASEAFRKLLPLLKSHA